MGTVLAGLLAFFLLEKMVLWRHAHGHAEHRHDEDESEHDHAMHADGEPAARGS
jgi:zinc and cadmium transporter